MGRNIHKMEGNLCPPGFRVILVQRLSGSVSAGRKFIARVGNVDGLRRLGERSILTAKRSSSIFLTGFSSIQFYSE